GRQLVLERRHAGFLRLLVLAAHIDFARRVVADQNHREPGQQIVLALDPRDFVRDARTKLRGNGFSVDDPGCHLIPSFLLKSERAELRQAFWDPHRWRSVSFATSPPKAAARFPWGRRALSPTARSRHDWLRRPRRWPGPAPSPHCDRY